MTKRST